MSKVCSAQVARTRHTQLFLAAVLNPACQRQKAIASLPRLPEVHCHTALHTLRTVWHFCTAKLTGCELAWVWGTVGLLSHAMPQLLPHGYAIMHARFVHLLNDLHYRVMDALESGFPHLPARLRWPLPAGRLPRS